MERRRRSTRAELPVEAMGKTVRRREKPRERWLLTRKTWRYMADAGRRLIPEGAQNRPEDIPRIEAYFQDVCSREPRFLLWRKSSYPGALPRPRRLKRPRGGSVRARSPSDDAPPPPVRPTDLYVGHVSGGRFDMAKLKRDFLAAPPIPARPPPSAVAAATTASNAADAAAADEDATLLEMLRKYLKVEEDEGVGHVSDADELVRALRRFLGRQGERTRDEAGARRPTDPARGDSDSAQRSLLDTLGRYYSRSPNRDHIVQDLLTDRKLLKKLYHDLRKTRSYRGGGGGGSGSGAYGGYGGVGGGAWRSGLRARGEPDGAESETGCRSPPLSPPPLIRVHEESAEERGVERGTQTERVSEESLAEAERAYRERLEAATAPTSPTSPTPADKARARRRSSVDHDDVSQSVSDTIKRYLRMARKKSVDADKADRFKRINYDKNLRNIKPKERSEFDDDAFNKGCQTVEEWMLTYRELVFASPPTSPSSPPSPGAPPASFLSALLGRGGGGGAPAVSAVPAGGMQKSRSSSSVVQSVSKHIWRRRSRSSSRVAANWTPQGSCAWVDGGGRAVRLSDTSLLTLSDVERRALQQAALARLQQLNLGCPIKIPEEGATVSSKPKRRAYLLKRKALTTGFFDQSRPKDGEKDKDGAGSVFGVPLAQCVEAERALRRQHGSRTSLASLGALERADDSESCDSGEWGSGSESRLHWAPDEAAGAGGPRVPALVSACLAHLRRHGLHRLGLFRVSSSKKRVRQLREEWERGAGGGGGGPQDALDATTCPHDVAALLKEFLRDLPDPLLCRDLYTPFLNTQKIRNRRLQWEALRLIVQLLPAANRDTLGALLGFLAQLAAHAHDTEHAAGNKMDAANLATLFAPNILHRSKPGEPASAEQLSERADAERADAINVVRLLIEKQAELWTLPAEMLHDAYIHLLHTQPAHLDSLLLRRAECAERASAEGAEGGAERRVWSREECLHGGAATGGPDLDDRTRRVVLKTRQLRTRDTASDTSSGSLASAMTIVTRVRSSVEECGSSGVVCSPQPSAPTSAATSATGRTDSAPDSADSASDYNETVGGSEDDDGCVIAASLHIPAAFGRESVSPSGGGGARRSPAAPPRRRRSSTSESSNRRDSAVGSGTAPSSPASWASSPPGSPPPAPPFRVTLTSAGEIRRRRDGAPLRQSHTAVDIDRMLALGRERNTSDARAVVLRQRDDAPPTLYKRGELISSARPPP